MSGKDKLTLTDVVKRLMGMREDHRDERMEELSGLVMDMFKERSGLEEGDVYRIVKGKRNDLYESKSEVYSPTVNRALRELVWDKEYLEKEGNGYRLTEKGRDYLGIEDQDPVPSLNNSGPVEAVA